MAKKTKNNKKSRSKTKQITRPKKKTAIRSNTVAKQKTKSKSRHKDKMKWIKDGIKGSLTGLGTKEVVDLILDQTPVPEIVQAPISIAASTAAGYAVGKTAGAIGGAAAASVIEAIRLIGGGNGLGGGTNEL